MERRDRESCSDLARVLGQARRVFVLTGAGLSTESGIPDFRGPDGLWTKHPEAMKMFDLASYRASVDVREAAWRVRLEGGITTAEPNAGHYALKDWASADRTVTVATQNIDGLQQRATPELQVLELHGTFWLSMCLSCDERRPIQEVFTRLEAGETDPACSACGGILKSATIAFGQNLDADVMAAAEDAAESCDLAVAIGSSLTVQPAASFCSVALASGAPLAIINAEPTGYDAFADIIIRGRIGEILTTVNQALTP